MILYKIRQDYKDPLDIMQLDYSSSEGSSSSDKDLHFLFLEAALYVWPSERSHLGNKINIHAFTYHQKLAFLFYLKVI